MKFSRFLVVLLAIPLLSLSVVHKYYVSVTDIEYVKEQQSVQIISRVFVDDFERMLRERYNKNITMNFGSGEAQIDAYTEKYLKTKLKITINGEPKDFKFLGKEYENDIVYFYMEIKNIPEVNSFEITNQVLFDVFNEQQNLIKTKINSKNKSFMLIPQNDKGVLNFN